MSPVVPPCPIINGMIEFTQLKSVGEIAGLKEAYLKTLVAPMDAYWENGLIAHSPHWDIRHRGKRIGYFCLDGEASVMQFFIVDDFVKASEEVFSQVISRGMTETAYAGTHEPAFLSLCLDRQKSVAVHTILFTDNERVEARLEAFPDPIFRQATQADIEKVVALHREDSASIDLETMEAAFGSQREYVEQLVDENQLFVLYQGDELLGTGECRISKSQPPYADVGMIVSEKHRRKGAGSYIIVRLKEYCYRNNTVPICSTTVENIASKKALEKAGFVSYHRILMIRF